jgi:hypothetical protein
LLKQVRVIVIGEAVEMIEGSNRESGIVELNGGAAIYQDSIAPTAWY